jgi:uncharacterized protein (DUF4415 family)
VRIGKKKIKEKGTPLESKIRTIALVLVRLDHVARMSAHRDDGKRYVVRADENLTAFMELESAISGLRRFDAARAPFA